MKKITRKEIGSIIKTVRGNMDLTQIQMAKKLAISQATLCKMEAGTAQPTAIQWMYFCDFAGIEPGILAMSRSEYSKRLVRVSARTSARISR